MITEEGNKSELRSCVFPVFFTGKQYPNNSSTITAVFQSQSPEKQSQFSISEMKNRMFYSFVL